MASRLGESDAPTDRAMTDYREQDYVRPGRIRDEQDGATAAAWGLCGIFVLFLGFVLAVIYWSPK